MSKYHNLLIGSNSQLAFYLRQADDILLSLNEAILNKSNFKKMYLLAAEQRTFMNLSYENFREVNVVKTLEFVENQIDNCEKIYLFFTGEFWNNCEGPVNLQTPFNYKPNNYIDSKYELYELIELYFQKDERIVKIFPFNFNSTKRNPKTFMGKVFQTLTERIPNNFLNLDFNRDICHTKYVAEKLMDINCDSIIASGYLTNMKKFVNDLCNELNVDKNLFILSKEAPGNNEFFYQFGNYTYETLLKDTIDDLKNVQSNYGYFG